MRRFFRPKNSMSLSPSSPDQHKSKTARSDDGASRFLLEPGGECIEYPLLVGKLFRFQLGVDKLPVGGYLETAPAGGDQFHILNLLLERTQQFARQTDGLWFIPSHGSVAQLKVHDDLLVWFRRRVAPLGTFPKPPVSIIVDAAADLVECPGFGFGVEKKIYGTGVSTDAYRPSQPRKSA